MSKPKRNSTRIIPLVPEAKEAIEELLAVGRWGDPQPGDVLFWGADRETPSVRRQS